MLNRLFEPVARIPSVPSRNRIIRATKLINLALRSHANAIGPSQVLGQQLFEPPATLFLKTRRSFGLNARSRDYNVHLARFVDTARSRPMLQRRAASSGHPRKPIRRSHAAASMPAIGESARPARRWAASFRHASPRFRQEVDEMPAPQPRTSAPAGGNGACRNRRYPTLWVIQPWKHASHIFRSRYSWR